VDRLLKKSMVYKKISTYDKRLVDVTISSKGLQALAKLDDKNEEFDIISRNLTEKEAETLNNLLDKMRSHH